MDDIKRIIKESTDIDKLRLTHKAFEYLFEITRMNSGDFITAQISAIMKARLHTRGIELGVDFNVKED